jgi:hypothetical protein
VDLRHLRLCWERLRIAEILEERDAFKGIDHLRYTIKLEWAREARSAQTDPNRFLEDLIRRSKGLHARGLSVPPEIEAMLKKPPETKTSKVKNDKSKTKRARS